MNECKPGVILEHAHFEDAHYGELLDPRHDAGGGDLALWSDDDNLLAKPCVHRMRKLGSEHDAKLSRLQILQFAALHVLADVGHLVFEIGYDAAQHGPL